MKRKLMWLTVIGVVSAIAYAQISATGAVGYGLAGAPDADQPNALFGFKVAQVDARGRTYLNGNFGFAFRGERGLVEINMMSLRSLEVNTENKTAVFTGPAVATVRTNSGVRRERGVVVVQVQDNRPAGSEEGDPDTIGVRFGNPDNENGFSFAYRGVVKQGDITVGSLSR